MMNTHADGIRESRSGSVADGTARRGWGRTPGRTPAAGSVDGGPGATAQRALQEAANDRPQVRQLREYQQIAGQNPQVRQIAQLREVVNHGGRMGAEAAAAPVQRRVRVDGDEIDSVVDVVGDEWETFLPDEDAETAGWMLGLSRTWDFSDRDDLVLFVDRVSAMTRLIRSIFTNGILSRERLHQQGIAYVGSEDIGNAGQIAVNVLDNRGGNRSAMDIASESMTAQDRGSISVAFEREKDWIQQSRDEKPYGEWTKPKHAELTEDEARQVDDLSAQMGEGMGGALANILKTNRAFAQNQALLNGLYNPEMTDRAQNTLMAVMPRPAPAIANLEEGDRSYESDVPGGRIAAGQGGFRTLLIPRWFEPFYLMLEDLQPPGVDVRFVGNRQVTAFYKSPLGQIPVTVDAPDYAGEVAAELQEFEYLATHILTA